MDSVAEPSRREILRQRVEEAKAALLDAANAGVIKNDPLCQHLSALALSVGAHYDIYCAAEEAQREVAESVRRHADTVTLGMLDTVRGSLNTMTKELGPQLLKTAAVHATSSAVHEAADDLLGARCHGGRDRDQQYVHLRSGPKCRADTG